MTNLDLILLAAGDPKQGGSIQLILMGGIIFVFYFFMIRPQSKKAKDQKLFIDNLQKGAKIVTNSGIYASIYKVNEDGTFQIEVNPGSYLKIDKSAVSMDMTVAATKSVTTA